MIVALLCLREPVRKGDLCPVAGECERLERLVDIGASHEEIEVLRLANDAGVVQDRVRATDQKRDARVAQHVQRATIEGVGVAPGIVEGRLVSHDAAVKCNSEARRPGARCRWPESVCNGAVPERERVEMAMGPDVVRIAAVSDIHYSKDSHGALQPLFAQITESADVLVLAGDLTDYGLAEEAKVLARDLTTTVKIPVVAVLGNHDYESGQEAELVKILSDAGVKMLDGDTFETHGVGFAGVRGFCGGFGRGALGAWGEPIIKEFVHEAVNEALKLESALARLHTEHRIAVLHYAPIRETVEGEPLEIFPFLGSSRLEEPLSRFDVTAVFHGHAHKGKPEGNDVEGYSRLQRRVPGAESCYPDRPPFRLFEVHTAKAPDESGVTPIGDRRHWGRRSTDRSATQHAQGENPSPS